MCHAGVCVFVCAACKERMRATDAIFAAFVWLVHTRDRVQAQFPQAKPAHSQKRPGVSMCRSVLDFIRF